MANPLLSFSEDLYVHTFAFCDYISLERLRTTCRRVRVIGTEPLLWLELLRHELSGTCSMLVGAERWRGTVDWRNGFKNWRRRSFAWRETQVTFDGGALPRPGPMLRQRSAPAALPAALPPPPPPLPRHAGVPPFMPRYLHRGAVVPHATPRVLHPPSAAARARRSAERVYHRVYIFGGQTASNTFLNDLWYFDVTSHMLHSPLAAAPPQLRLKQVAQPVSFTTVGRSQPGSAWPEPRAAHSLTAHRGSVVLFGGVGRSNQFFSDTWLLQWRGATDADLAGSRSVYNSDGVWTRIAEHHAPLLPPGYGHFSAALSSPSPYGSPRSTASGAAGSRSLSRSPPLLPGARVSHWERAAQEDNERSASFLAAALERSRAAGDGVATPEAAAVAATGGAVGAAQVLSDSGDSDSSEGFVTGDDAESAESEAGSDSGDSDDGSEGEGEAWDNDSADEPAARWGHTVTALGDQLLLFGGSCPGRAFNDLWLLADDLSRWLRLRAASPSPPARGGHCAAGVGTTSWARDGGGGARLFIFGGNTTETTFNDLWCLHLAPTPSPLLCGVNGFKESAMRVRWSEVQMVGPRPQPRIGHSAVVMGKQLLVFGGRDFIRRSFCRGIFMVDLEDAATQLQARETPASNCSQQRGGSGWDVAWRGADGGNARGVAERQISELTAHLTLAEQQGPLGAAAPMAAHPAMARAQGHFHRRRPQAAEAAGGVEGLRWARGRGREQAETCYVFPRIPADCAPCSRTGHMAAVLPAGGMLIFGGMGEEGFLDDAAVLDVIPCGRMRPKAAPRGAKQRVGVPPAAVGARGPLAPNGDRMCQIQ